MGEAYLDFAPKLVQTPTCSACLPALPFTDPPTDLYFQGYTYSVFNLVFANNPASIRIWEKLGFEVIGRVPKAARLANSEELVDALIFGRGLGG